MKRSIILTDKALLTRFILPQDDGGNIEPVELPNSAIRPREEFYLNATFEMTIRSTNGKNIQLSFDLTDGQDFIDTNELLKMISDSFVESKNEWENMSGNTKKYRLTLEEV